MHHRTTDDTPGPTLNNTESHKSVPTYKLVLPAPEDGCVTNNEWSEPSGDVATEVAILDHSPTEHFDWDEGPSM